MKWGKEMKKAKKVIALLLALVCLASALAACGSNDSGGKTGSPDQVSSGKIKLKKQSDATEEAKREADSDSAKKKTELASSFDGLSGVDYVMVYNPDIYVPALKSSNKTLSTGRLSNWIDTNVNRADGLEEEVNIGTLSQEQLLGALTGIEDPELTSDRAAGLAPTYKEGDTHKFFYNDASNSNLKKSDTFTCVKVGKNCYVWMLDSDKSKKSDAERIAKEFDEKTYEKDTSLYGSARFVEDGGKLNLLFHPMVSYVGGYFMPLELFTFGEMLQLDRLYMDIDGKSINTDHAIIHINSSFLGKKSTEEYINATVGHEFQHLINFSSSLAGGYDLNLMDTWLNEAMSGYIEEVLYPGTQKRNGRYAVLERSDYIRGGISLYNFMADDKDAGVYGSVFLFSEYLNEQAGEKKIFKKIHDAWRTRKTKTFSTEESIYKAVPDTYKKNIDSLVDYPSSYKFETKEKEWMSKMTLDFYLSLMKFEKSDPKEYEDLHIERLLYDEVNPAKLEGGGRIIFATKDGKFSIPSDADSKLVYVGFDKKFNQVTDIICK